MELNELHNKLIAAGRATPADERVPYAFEQRIMAQLAGISPLLDRWAVWGSALWRAAAPCVAVTLLCAAWALWSHEARPPEDFSQDFKSAVFASATPDDAW